MGKAKDITDAIISACNANHDTFDLSGTDVVRLGHFDGPWRTAAPCAYVTAPEVVSDYTAGEFTAWGRSATVEVVAFAPPSSGTADARARAALDLATDLSGAVESAFATGGTLYVDVDTLNIAVQAIDGQVTDMPTAHGYGVALLVVEFTYRTGTEGI